MFYEFFIIAQIIADRASERERERERERGERERKRERGEREREREREREKERKKYFEVSTNQIDFLSAPRTIERPYFDKSFCTAGKFLRNR